jgi:hypothetical protein
MSVGSAIPSYLRTCMANTQKRTATMKSAPSRTMKTAGRLMRPTSFTTSSNLNAMAPT